MACCSEGKAKAADAGAEKPKKKVPEWATGDALQDALVRASRIDPDDIFGQVPTTCDLQGAVPPYTRPLPSFL